MLSDNLHNNEDLLRTVKEYELLTSRCDFDVLVPFIAEDAVYWFNDGSYRGISEIRKAFKATWSSFGDGDYTITNTQWLVSTDSEAVCIYNFHYGAVVKGKPFEYSGRGTNVFKRVDGRWKIVHEHLSEAV